MHVSASIVVYLFTAIAFLSGIAVYLNPSSDAHTKCSEDESCTVSGRFVSIPAKDYINAFKAPIKLGQCPLVMKDGNIQTCKDEFEGEKMYLPIGATTVDDSSVWNAADILSHTMGGVGTSIGVLGLVDVNPKIKVAVTTVTGNQTFKLVRSYAIRKGVKTLRMPRPKFVEGDKALFLSEIEIGGNEMLLVTLQFFSLRELIEVETSSSFKNIFISITAKLEHIEKTFQYKASCRIQFTSSWRNDLDEYLPELSNCVLRVKQIEDLYMEGPQELRDMSPEDEKSHYFYHFSSWKASPYGAQFNFALIKHDLEYLSEWNTELKAVIERTNKLLYLRMANETKTELLLLNTTLTDVTQRITNGLKEYHNLNPAERKNLRDIYGRKYAPMHYDRYLQMLSVPLLLYHILQHMGRR